MSIQPDTFAAKAASAAQWGGSGVAIASGPARVLGLTTDEWTILAAICGIAVALLGFALNWVYRERHYQLAKKLADSPEEARAMGEE